MATSTLLQNLEEAAATMCSEKFGYPSQESLPKFKEHLFLMTAVKVYHIRRKHGEGLKNWWGGGSFSQCIRSMGEGLPRKRKIST